MIKKRSVSSKMFAFWLPVFLAALLAVFTVSPVIAAQKTKKAKKVKLSVKSLTMVQYTQQKLKLNNAKGSIKWKSSNKAVATVTKKGLVKAVGAGKCKITARFNKKKYSCTLTVVPWALSAESLTISLGESAVLKMNNMIIQPEWTSSDEQVAIVLESGAVIARSPGTCIVTASYMGTQLTCRVTVPVKVVLAGSSAMSMWTAAEEAFLPYEVINTAVSGSTVMQWMDWASEKIIRYRPSGIVLYAGSNDLSNGETMSGEQNAENTIRLLQKIRGFLPTTPIFYISINPSHSRPGAWDVVAASNEQMKQYCAAQADMYYIDIASAFRGADGKPDPNLFLSDQLHPNDAGYAVWKQLIAGTVKGVLGGY